MGSCTSSFLLVLKEIADSLGNSDNQIFKVLARCKSNGA